MILALAACLPALAFGQQQELQEEPGRRYSVYGVMFYNLENLFDTINNNGRQDYDFTSMGAYQWNGTKYWQKEHNMAYAISQMEVKGSPAEGPVIIGVSEIENITVLQDLVKQPELKDRRYQIVHHDSPDPRGIDVALLYNPRFFKVLNVTTQRINKYLPEEPDFRTRDQLCVTGMLAGEKVTVMVNHWPSRRNGQEASSYLREAAGRMARATIDSLLRDDPNQGIIFMGDLNDDPQDKSCSEALGAKREMADCPGDGTCFNPWWAQLREQGQAHLDLLACRGAQPQVPPLQRGRAPGLPLAHPLRRHFPERLQRPFPHDDLSRQGNQVRTRT